MQWFLARFTVRPPEADDGIRLNGRHVGAKVLAACDRRSANSLVQGFSNVYCSKVLLRSSGQYTVPLAAAAEPVGRTIRIGRCRHETDRWQQCEVVS